MKWIQIKKLSKTAFRRLTGIKLSTFEKMIEILKKEEQKQKAFGGRKNKLSIEDRLLMTLEYMREYRTYFHIGQSYGISESSAYKNICWVENSLIKNPIFSLPGKKELLKSKNEIEIVLIDATETPIERPKKNKNHITLVRKKDIQ